MSLSVVIALIRLEHNNMIQDIGVYDRLYLFRRRGSAEDERKPASAGHGSRAHSAEPGRAVRASIFHCLLSRKPFTFATITVCKVVQDQCHRFLSPADRRGRVPLLRAVHGPGYCLCAVQVHLRVMLLLPCVQSAPGRKEVRVRPAQSAH